MPGEDDDALKQQVADAVMAVIRAADDLPRSERTAYVVRELQKIKDRPEFARTKMAS